MENEKFIHILNMVKKEIVTNNDIVNNKTKNNRSGIYMLFVNDFSDNKIIPIYIGQSVNLQKRYKKHYMDLLALNHLNFTKYEMYFNAKATNFYEGHYRVCKIFKYMIEHKNNLSDLKMVVLEYCDNNLLDILEQKYIKKFYSEYFGFNQLNILTIRPKLIMENDNSIEEYLNEVILNCKNIQKYINYGYTTFNYNYIFPYIDKIDINSNNEKIVNLINKTNKALFMLRDAIPFNKAVEDILNYKKEQDILETQISKIKIPIYEELQIQEKCKIELMKKLKSKFLSIRFQSQRLEEFIKGIYDDPSKKAFKNYLLKRDEHRNPYQIFQNEINEIRDIDLRVEKIADNLKPDIDCIEDKLTNINNEIKLSKKNIIKEILPTIEFQQFYLGCYYNNDFFEEKVIFIILSNNGRNKATNIIKINLVYDNHKYEFFVDNNLTQKIKEGISYRERNFYDCFSFYKEPFVIVPDEYECFDGIILNSEQISIAVEYRYGINDLFIKQQTLETLEDITNKIKSIIGNDRKIKIKCSESKNALSEALSEYDENIQDFYEIKK